MSFYISIAIAATILVPAGLALARLKRSSTVYLPFFILLWVGVATEIANVVLAYTLRNNALSINLYSLAAALLLNWQFRRWELISDQRWYYILQGAMVAGWLVAWAVYGSLHHFFSWYMVGSAVVALYFASLGLTRFFYLPASKLWRHATWLICMGLIVFNLYSLLTELMYLYGLDASRFFRLYVQHIMHYVILIVYAFFTYAILWIPLKRNYIMGY